MIRDILKQEGQTVIKELRDSFARNKINASGKLSATLNAEVKDNRLIVDAEGYVFTAEDGRGPTRNSGPGDLFKRIFQWTKDKGIAASSDKQRRGIAFAITKSIHEKGTKLFRKGGKSGVISKVINDSVVDRIEKRLADVIEVESLEAIVRNRGDGNTTI